MAHEAIATSVNWVVPRIMCHFRQQVSYLVIRSSMLRGSRIKVGRVILLRSAPGLSWEMMCVSTLL